MKKRLSKMTLVTGILCAMSVTMCACSKEPEASVQEEQQADAEEADAAGVGEAGNDESGNAADTAENGNEGNAADTAENGNDGNVTDTAENGNDGSAADDKQADGSAPQDTQVGWEDSSPDLEGDIKEMQDGRLTVIEAESYKSDDGAGDVMSTPAPGAEDSDFNKVVVTYDEKTLFAVKTIYDGGAGSEMEEATADALEKGRTVEVWGEASGDGIQASQICIIKVM